MLSTKSLLSLTLVAVGSAKADWYANRWCSWFGETSFGHGWARGHCGEYALRTPSGLYQIELPKALNGGPGDVVHKYHDHELDGNTSTLLLNATTINDMCSSDSLIDFATSRKGCTHFILRIGPNPTDAYDITLPKNASAGVAEFSKIPKHRLRQRQAGSIMPLSAQDTNQLSEQRDLTESSTETLESLPDRGPVIRTETNPVANFLAALEKPPAKTSDKPESECVAAAFGVTYPRKTKALRSLATQAPAPERSDIEGMFPPEHCPPAHWGKSCKTSTRQVPRSLPTQGTASNAWKSPEDTQQRLQARANPAIPATNIKLDDHVDLPSLKCIPGLHGFVCGPPSDGVQSDKISRQEDQEDQDEDDNDDQDLASAAGTNTHDAHISNDLIESVKRNEVDVDSAHSKCCHPAIWGWDCNPKYCALAVDRRLEPSTSTIFVPASTSTPEPTEDAQQDVQSPTIATPQVVSAEEKFALDQLAAMELLRKMDEGSALQVCKPEIGITMGCADKKSGSARLVSPLFRLWGWMHRGAGYLVMVIIGACVIC